MRLPSPCALAFALATGLLGACGARTDVSGLDAGASLADAAADSASTRDALISLDAAATDAGADAAALCRPGDTSGECGPGAFCAGPDYGPCGGKDVFMGVCKLRPDDCVGEPLDPVCGCDLVTYDNACLAHAAGVDALAGRCPIGPPCSSFMPCALSDTTECVGDPSCTTAFDCEPHMHVCATTTTAFCGCDGVTWFDRGGCARRPYVRAGECDPQPTAVDCDRSHVSCDSLPPDCRAYPDTVASVGAGCWTLGCAPLTTCGCTTDDACPDPAWRCDPVLGRCRPRP